MAPDVDDALAQAGLRTFTRFGYRRTTMAELADAAGMSRPALYLRVANKGEMLLAVARRLLAASLAEAEAAAAGPGTTADRLHAVLSAKLEVVLSLAERSDHAVELLAVHAGLDPDGARDYTRAIEEIVTRVLGTDGTDTAVLLTRCVAGLDADMHTPELARRRLRLLVDLVAAGLAGRVPPTGS